MVDGQRISTSPQKSQGPLRKNDKTVAEKSVERELEELKEGVPDPQDDWQEPQNNDFVVWTEPQEAWDNEESQDQTLVSK